MEFEITLPWPNSALFQNSREYFRVKAGAKAAARYAAKITTREAIGRATGFSPIQQLTFEFHPPDRRRRDIQNMPESMKAPIDGIADALGVDDHEFQAVYPKKFASIERGGKVVVKIEPVDP